MNDQEVLKSHVLELLQGRFAHISLRSAIRDFPLDRINDRPGSSPHSAWELLEHIRIAQWDILQFTIDPHHVSPDFPDGYWPPDDAPPNPEAWKRSIAAFQADLKAMTHLVADPKTALFNSLAHGQGQTILREALLVADHNAYHLGQLVTVRRLLGAWRNK